MAAIWHEMTPPLRTDDIVRLALGPGKAGDLVFTTWQALLSEIIVGDAFGVDRMDYLLRDSYHLGVPYGRFDHFRLIDTLRILPSGDGGSEPSLGVELGGLDSAEALLLGRYYMYSQVYIHPTRRIYDIHLKDFLAAWLPGGKFPTDIPSHLARTDNEVFAGILLASSDSTCPGHDAARRVAEHDHFKLLYQRHPVDIRVNPEAGTAIYKAAVAHFGEANVRRDSFGQSRDANRFPVLYKDGRLGVADEASVVLQHLPLVTTDFVFIHPDSMTAAQAWLVKNRGDLIRASGEK